MDMRGTQGQGPRPDPDELRAAFQRQSRAELAQSRSQQARIARWAGMAFSVLLGLGAATVLVTRLSEGRPAGLWAALCAVSLLLTVAGFALAKLGRTRWTIAALALAVLVVQLGDSLGFFAD
ncbi:hypothetical protein [Streptomyces sp. Da 82-17]|uniref:hypothetical protein n=1 Tax=Streptomyces sp. Da 82-17 TaxID=3377116 RepID=UPI0038D3DAF0